MKTAVDQFFAEDVAALTAGLADLEERIEPLELPENDAVLGELEALMGRALGSLPPSRCGNWRATPSS